jgi:hypothetical protein
VRIVRASCTKERVKTACNFSSNNGVVSIAEHVQRGSGSVRRVLAASFCLPINSQGRSSFMDHPWTSLAFRDMPLSSYRFGFWSATHGGMDQSIKISGGPEESTS